MASYVNINSQPSRLGEFQLAPGERFFGDFGDFGASDAVAGINAVGNAVTNVVRAITQSESLKVQYKERRKIAIHLSTESRLKLGIQTKGATEQAAIDVERVKAKYGSITKLILGAGTVFAGVIIAGAFAYKLASGDGDDYEII